eukprot:5487904-Pyramimonas_sp.AAC.1
MVGSGLVEVGYGGGNGEEEVWDVGSQGRFPGTHRDIAVARCRGIFPIWSQASTSGVLDRSSHSRLPPLLPSARPRRFLSVKPTPTRGRKEAAQGGIYPLTIRARLQRVFIEGRCAGCAVHGQIDEMSWKSGPHQPC